MVLVLNGPTPWDWTEDDCETRPTPMATYHLRPATAQEFTRFAVDAVAFL